MYYHGCLQGGCSGLSVLWWGGAGRGRASCWWPGECGQWVQPPPVLRHIRVRQGVSRALQIQPYSFAGWS